MGVDFDNIWIYFTVLPLDTNLSSKIGTSNFGNIITSLVNYSVRALPSGNNLEPAVPNSAAAAADKS